MVLFLALYTCDDQYSAEDSRRILQISRVLFLLQLFPPVLCPANSSCLGFSTFWLLLIQLALPRFPLSASLPGTSPQAVSWDNDRAHLVCFLSLRDHCSLLPGVQCLKAIVFILSGFPLVSGKRVNPVPVTPSWPELWTFTSERNKWLYCLTHCYFGFSVICSQV